VSLRVLTVWYPSSFRRLRSPGLFCLDGGTYFSPLLDICCRLPCKLCEGVPTPLSHAVIPLSLLFDIVAIHRLFSSRTFFSRFSSLRWLPGVPTVFYFPEFIRLRIPLALEVEVAPLLPPRHLVISRRFRRRLFCEWPGVASFC